MAQERRTRPCKAPRFRRPITAGRRSDGVAVSHAWPPPPALPFRHDLPFPIERQKESLAAILITQQASTVAILIDLRQGKCFRTKN
jgi:hypothetical protein